MNPSNLPGIDITGTIARLGLDYEDIRDILTGLPASLKGYLAAAETGVNSNDAESVRTAAHSLTGLAGNFGLPAVRAAAHALESAAREKRPEDFPELLAALHPSIAQACESLAKLP